MPLFYRHSQSGPMYPGEGKTICCNHVDVNVARFNAGYIAASFDDEDFLDHHNLLFVFQYIAGCTHDGKDVVFKDDTSLEIYHIGFSYRTISRQLNRRSLNKISCSHDDLIRIAWHIVRYRRDVRINR